MVNEGETIREIVYQKKIAVAEIARGLGVSRTMVYNYFDMDVLPDDVKKKLLKLTGVNEPEFKKILLKGVKGKSDLAGDADNKIKYLNVTGKTEPHTLNLYVVPIKAFGGFLVGYNEPAFMESLEKESFEHIHGECYKFEVEGYSMFLSKVIDGELFTTGYEPGSWVIATVVESFDWLTKGKNYVFQSTEGIIIKRFVRIEKDTLHVESINKDYSTKPLQLKSVKRVYLVEWHEAKT